MFLVAPEPLTLVSFGSPPVFVFLNLELGVFMSRWTIGGGVGVVVFAPFHRTLNDCLIWAFSCCFCWVIKIFTISSNRSHSQPLLVDLAGEFFLEWDGEIPRVRWFGVRVPLVWSIIWVVGSTRWLLISDMVLPLNKCQKARIIGWKELMKLWIKFLIASP